MRQSLDGAIHTIRKDESVPDFASPATGEVGYTVGHMVDSEGKEQPYIVPTMLKREVPSGEKIIEELYPNPLCLAKMVVVETNGVIRDYYYIKAKRNGELFDPWGTTEHRVGSTTDSWERRVQMREPGLSRGYYEFTKVGIKAFEFYLKYLMSRNGSWLKNAQREAFSG